MMMDEEEDQQKLPDLLPYPFLCPRRCHHRQLHQVPPHPHGRFTKALSFADLFSKSSSTVIYLLQIVFKECHTAAFATSEPTSNKA
ncbi:hypothetical protein VNO78_01274 [Psophocarpus tetragonolobus]|uniref:Uncharacterized protein n=1 Tax=Psophocarpus tetragonolobus TaxID=3891 RepID=A0AAN9T969_PSOTE